MCTFHTYYFGKDGYVARCKNCNCYQVVFHTTMIMLSEINFHHLRVLAADISAGNPITLSGHSKSVIIPLPQNGVNLILTAKETGRFADMLERADTEEKAQAIIRLFETP